MQISKYPLFILALLFPLFGYAESPPYEVIPDKATLPILNPAFQGQKTLKIKLANGLEAVLVSDPIAEQANVTVTVMAGSWQNPDEHPGLAHFLEHMLFLGTKEYPLEGEFNRFLAENGGETNAFTHGDYTSYMFTVNTPQLSEALNRLSSFFKYPLFNPSGVDRELHAIDQEFAQSFNSDDSREYAVLLSLANPKHPGHRFTTGNSASLANATTDDLRKWFESHYSSDVMHLYIRSSLPLDTLKEMVVKDFGSIPKREIEHQNIQVPLLQPGLTGHLILIDAKKNTYTLTLLWEIPQDVIKMLSKKPDDLLCYVIGHEGKESALAELKREGLADELGCGSVDLSSTTSLFAIQAKLTKKGFDDYNTVIERIFQTIARLKSTPYPPELFNELATQLKQHYQFQQHENPFSWAMKQATWLAKEPIETYPELSQFITTLDQKAITDLLNVLTPENSVITLSAPSSNFKEPLTEKEEWMQVPYSVKPLPKELLDHWAKVPMHPSILLPTPNPYIATNLSLTPPPYKRDDYPFIPGPIKLLDNKGILAYYAPDPFYQVPRSFIRFLIQSPEIKEGSPQIAALTDLYAKSVEDALRDMTYYAKMADLNIHIEHTLGGIQITLEGYSDSIKKFFPSFLKEFLAFNLSSEKFQEMKEALDRDYDNALKEMPAKQTIEYVKAAIYQNYSLYSQKKTALKKVQYENFQKLAKKLFTRTFIKSVITGTLTKEQSLEIVKQFDEAFHKNENSYALSTTPAVLHLPNKSGPYALDTTTEAEGDAVLLLLEVDGFSPRLRNLQSLLTDVVKEAFFNEIRTKQQTGYIVLADATDIQKILFDYFLVQSTSHVPDDLLWRFELFFESYLKNLSATEVPESRFENMKKALAITLKEPPPSLLIYGEQLYKLAFDIQDFDWMKKRLEDLPKIDYAEFLTFADQFLGRQNKRRFGIMLEGQHENRFDYIIIDKLGKMREKRGKN